MIGILREIIPNKTTVITDTEPVTLEKVIPGNLYKRGLAGSINKINESFESDLNWLIIKKLIETGTAHRVLEEIPIENFSVDQVGQFLLKYFQRCTEGIRIVCSPETFSILAKLATEDRLFGASFFCTSTPTLLSVPVIQEDIPTNEIWLIDLNSWLMMTTPPNNSVEFNFKQRVYVYQRSFRVSNPRCIGSKLIRIQIMAENPEAKEMRELMDRMRLPARNLSDQTCIIPSGQIVPTGECVWLTENPELGLCVTTNPSKEEVKTFPQMFNPGAPLDPLKLKIKKRGKIK
jgi:hypothetical protein